MNTFTLHSKVKQVVTVLLLCFAIISCDTLTIKREKKDSNATAADYFNEERAKQIEYAKRNRELILGKWKIIKLKDNQADEFQPAKNRYTDLVFDTYEFLPRSQYVFYKGGKVVENGTMEWMAEDREIVFTPNTDLPVGRLLIRGINNRYMNANSRTLYMILKKVLPDSSSKNDQKKALKKHV